MTTYRFSDEATSDHVEAERLEAAVAKYLENYDTAEMESGDTFTAKVFSGEEDVLCTIVTVTADGKSRVEDWEISPR